MAAEWKAKGNTAFTSQKFDEAVHAFTEAIKLTPNDHVLYSNRSGAYASLTKYQEALEDSLKCISLKPDWPKGYSRKGLTQYQLGDIKGAILTYKKGLELDPNNTALQTGLKQAEEKDPDLLLQRRVNMLAQTLLRTPKFKTYCDEDSSYAKKLTTILEEILKDAKNLQIVMSMCNDVRIKEALTTILGLPTEEVDEEEEQIARKERARAKVAEEEKIRKRREAETRVKTPEEIEGDKWKEKGNELYKERRFEEALDAYDKAIQANSNDIAYLNNKAAVYLEMGNFEQCIAECQKALERRYEVKADYEKVAKVYNRMATCYKRKGDLANCIAMYEKSLMEDNNRHIRAALSDVKRLKEKRDTEAYINPALAEEHRLKGNEYFKANDFPSAKKEYDEAIRRNPEDAKLYANRAAALIKLLELPGALKDADKSLELDPSVAKVWARKGNIHSLMKEYNKAISAYQKGLDIDPNSTECQQGFSNTLLKVQESTYSDKVDEEQVKHSMADPEIQALLADPQFRMTLNRIQEDPKGLMEALKDPAIATGIQKLMAAGIVKMA